MKCLELFTGAGGLAMGLGRAGFSHAGLVEFNHDACETMRYNSRLPESPLASWPIIESDTRSILDFGDSFKDINVVAGGPPCQPFSIGGKARGARDNRDMFPEAVRAVRQTHPQAFIFENVKGLLRESFADYFEYVILQMTYPTVTRKKGEEVAVHRARLQKLHTQGGTKDLQYRVVWQLLNAADYGVPQKRERVFMVGFRSDLHVQWSFPALTHSKAVLERDKHLTGEYYERHKVSRKHRIKPAQYQLQIAPEVLERVAHLQPWQTVRDTTKDLPTKAAPEINHQFIDGARPYPGHTGSHIDDPAKTLKAGDHGVPGGENMVVLPNGTTRYFTLREAARMQTFPDSYRFARSWSESMRQLGNAVPVRLAEVVGKSVHDALKPVAS
jgi:DNA (cytosine-5)-methyltransferase 1